MGSRRLRVVLDPAGVWGSVSGHGSYELVTRLGRRPIWSVRDAAWMVMHSTAGDVIAVAEARGWTVEVETAERPPAEESTAAPLRDEPLDDDELQGVLWGPS